MIKEKFNMLVQKFNVAKAYVHSLEEPARETLQTITDAIKNGNLPGVQAMGNIAKDVAISMLPTQPQLALAEIKPH